MLTSEAFPYKQLSDQDKKLVIINCGNYDPVKEELLRNFLKISGQSTVGNKFERDFFDDISWRSVNALNLPGHEAAQASNRGLLLYAGLLKEVCKIEKVPYHNSVLREVGDADAKHFALESYTRINDELPSFRAFANQLRTPMRAEDESLFNAVLVGAGALHSITVESWNRKLDPSSISNEHPELADLEEMFNEGFGQL